LQPGKAGWCARAERGVTHNNRLVGEFIHPVRLPGKVHAQNGAQSLDTANRTRAEISLCKRALHLLANGIPRVRTDP
jgi:hypothetical protein